MKIAIIGAGYVGMSMAVLLSQKNEVCIVDTVVDKVELINCKKSPIVDREIEEYLAQKQLSLTATLSIEEGVKGAEYIIIAVPTNYDEEKKVFDTSVVEYVLDKLVEYKSEATVVIKSTIPIGYTESVRSQKAIEHILFCPEFLRESRALYDNLYPSRIIVGYDLENTELYEKARVFASELVTCALKEQVDVLYMGYTEAEAIKLFSNTYLAMRISFFNELDTYAEMNQLNSESIIRGMCLDPRIGSYYNNPSFGYGGYCLPKDTKQLRENFNGIPQKLIDAIVDSNKVRKHFIADVIMEKCKERKHDGEATVGVYRLTMKSKSDNFRKSAIIDIMHIIAEQGIKIKIYEPTLSDGTLFEDFVVCNDLAVFKETTDCILVNRYDEQLDDVREKVYTRDIFGCD